MFTPHTSNTLSAFPTLRRVVPALGTAAFTALIISSTAQAKQASPAAHTKPSILAAHAKTAAPTVAQIIDDYIAATGGKAAYDKIKSSEASGTLELVAQKITGTLDVKQKAPDKFYSSQTIGGIGKIEQGYDGKTAWSRDPVFGGRILAGAELAQTQMQARLNGVLQWKELYPKSELLGERLVNGSKAYAVRLTPAKGHPATQFYDIKTKLMVRQDQIADSPQGAIPTESYFADYKSVDGVKAPFTTRMVQAGTEVMIKITQVKNNVSLADSLFAVPADIHPAPAK